MPIKLKNNASGFLATAISASDTGLVLQAGNGTAFPTLAATDYFYATLVSTGGTQEVVKVTARVGDTMTVVRAQEGSSAAGFAAGSRLEMRVTAGSIAGYVQDRIVSVRDFGAVGDGVTDDTAAIQAAVTAAKAVFFPTGTYLVSSEIALSNDNISLRGDGTATIRAAFASSSTNAVFRMAGSGATGSIVTATADIVYGANVIDVSSVTGFAVNDVIQITSTEYFNGIVGASGFGIRTKGELSRVRAVGVSSLTLDESTKDTYSVSGETVSIQKRGIRSGLVVSGLRFYGTGGGAAHTASTPTGARALICSDVHGVQIINCVLRNFPRFGFELSRCKDIVVSGCEFYGYDLADPSDVPPAATQWFTSATFNSCENVTFSSNVGRNCRRHFDADSAGSGAPVSRNLTVVGNTATNTTSIVGTHACDRIVITGNVGVASGGIIMRGKNATITNNSLGLANGTTFAISCGYNGTAAYSEQVSIGAVVVSGNTVVSNSPVTRGIYINGDTQAGIVADNILDVECSDAILIGGKRTENLLIARNTIRVRTAISGVFTGVFIPNFTAMPREILQHIHIVGNTIRLNGAGSAIACAGAPKTAPANNIVIANNTITGDGLRHIGLVHTGSDGTTAYFGPQISIHGNTMQASSVSSGFVNFAYSQMAQIPNILGNTSPDSAVGDYETTNTGSPLGTTGATYIAGMRVANVAPSAGGFIGKVCVQSGTVGTLSITGDITSGSAQLTVSSVSNLAIGYFVTISGSGITSARITAIAGLVCTLDTTATTTVTGAAVAYVNPVFKDFAAIAV